jgi:hypothetical protein
MRGTEQQQSHVFSGISPERRARSDHPLRPIRAIVDEILKQLSPLSPLFNKMYAKVGRPPIPPEQLLRAQDCCVDVLHEKAWRDIPVGGARRSSNPPRNRRASAENHGERRMS